ncbi:MAG: hypothetical protein R6U58_07915 [Bacteroidales bacterium]
MRLIPCFILMCFVGLAACGEGTGIIPERNTKVSIVGDQFHINGSPTYEGRIWTTSYGGQYSVEGLLMNARFVQGVFDDLNPQTRGQWIYPDTKEWDADRNTREFINAMASWREHGLLAFTLNLQGGCPYGYCREQPWDNSAFAPDGSLRDDYMFRLDQVLSRADELGMVVILGYFYFGQDDNLADEAAVIRAVENATRWILEKGFTNVIVEINNECNVRYDHDILKCARVHELINMAKKISVDGRSLYVSTSLGGGSVPPAGIVEASDFILLHGNGVRDPERMMQMIREVREMDVYEPMPVVNNEDDQPWRVEDQGWGDDGNNFVECVKNYASWGFFDFRLNPEHNDYNKGYQGIPVNWQISSERKRGFFGLLAEITGSPGTLKVDAGFSGEVGKITANIEGVSSDAPVEQVMLVVNDDIITILEDEPYEFILSEIPDKDHWIKIRVIYSSAGRQVIIESPYYQNPWWPYGGPSG